MPINWVGYGEILFNQIYQEITWEVQISEKRYQMHSLMNSSPRKSWWVYSPSVCTSGFICSILVSSPAWLLTLVKLPVELLSIKARQLHYFVNCIQIVNQAEPLGVLTDRLCSINKSVYLSGKFVCRFPLAMAVSIWPSAIIFWGFTFCIF